MAIDDATILSFWGKARATDAASDTWHTAAYHLIDVAESADAILRVRPRLLARGASLLGLPADETRRLAVALASLHDLGKFAWRFQAKVQERYPPVLGSWRASPAGASHAADGLKLWERCLEAALGPRLWSGGTSALGPLAQATFGHHGRPVRSTPEPVGDVFGTVGLEVALASAERVLDVLGCAPIVGAATPTAGTRASWWLSGVITLADWVGSQERFFTFRAANHSLEEYRERIARPSAEQAVRACGLVPPVPAPLRGFVTVTGITGVPTDAQARAADVVLPAGPMLVLVEDVTGAGKTEAAQMLVHRLIADGRATGAYWAMPTQATANAMYERQRAMIEGLYESAGPRPSLVLAHGQARLSDRFRRTVLRDDDVVPNAHALDAEGTAGDTGDDEPTSTIACAAFLADDRRAGLLADVGAGTIDQALLAVLPSRFNTMRLAGLGDKVLVLDEAHAYDAYMSEEITALLRFQAALGGSAVVLSATLSGRQWKAIMHAWQEGLGLRGARVVAAERLAAYPLMTVVGASDAGGEVTQVPLPPSPRPHRDLEVALMHSVEVAVSHVAAAARAGGAVAWIRNTVDECLAAAALLRAEGLDPIVFHARFAQGDRQRREREVLELFGRPDAAHPDREAARRGRVLVATQVVEQSLDLDFDVMLSDLAPIDLLIQRAGRLWRHPARDAWRRAHGFGFRFFVLTPAPTETPAADWPAPLLPKVRLVYEHVGVLWRTAETLARCGRIVTPGEAGEPSGLRALIEAVYGEAEDPDASLPPTLRAAAARAEGDEGALTEAGRYVVLKLRDGYDASAAAWSDDLRAVTRLGDGSTIVRLARAGAQGALEPWDADTSLPEWQRWSLSEVRVAPYRIPAGSRPPSDHESAVHAYRSLWGRWEQDITVLPLTRADSGVWRGRVIRPDGSVIEAVASERDGLIFAPSATATVGASGEVAATTDARLAKGVPTTKEEA